MDRLSSGLAGLIQRSIGALLIIALAAQYGFAEDLEKSRQSLAEIRQRIKQTSRSLEQKKAAERSLAQDLKVVEQEESSLKRRVKKLDERLEALKKSLEDKQLELQQTRVAIGARQRQVEKRLAAIYKGGEMGLLKVLFTAESPARMAEDYFYFRAVVREDRKLLSDYRGQLKQLTARVEDLAALRNEQEQALSARRAEQQTLREASRLKKQLLGQVRTQRRELAGNLEQLKERAARLQGLVKKLESKQGREYTEKTTLFTRQKGRLPWPVNGPVKIGFGKGRHPELGTLYESNGIEILISGQAPIKAVGDGRVIFANWFKGYGNLMILDHGASYYTLYAQAGKLNRKVGEQVKKGDVVGYSGFEGSDTVYFEIRHKGTPLNPMPWLRSR